MIETNIDDMSSEIYSYLIDLLFENGARDVSYTSLYMKKNRPGVKLSVIVDENNKEIIENIIFKETTTFGLRKYEIERTVLERKFVEVDTIYGKFNLKSGYLNDELIKVTPEYEECKDAARKFGLPISYIYDYIKIFIEKNIK